MKEVPYTLFAGNDAFSFLMDDYFKPKCLSQEEEKKTFTWQELWDALNKEETPFVLFSANRKIMESPEGQPGRDFGLLLAGLANLSYAAQWRADQNKVYLFAYKKGTAYGKYMSELQWDEILHQEGLLAKLFPVQDDEFAVLGYTKLNYQFIPTLFQDFTFHFANAGYMIEGQIYTATVKPKQGIKENRSMQKIIRDTFASTI